MASAEWTSLVGLAGKQDPCTRTRLDAVSLDGLAIRRDLLKLIFRSSRDRPLQICREMSGHVLDGQVARVACESDSPLAVQTETLSKGRITSGSENDHIILSPMRFPRRHDCTWTAIDRRYCIGDWNVCDEKHG
jgi:hypothetical protein